MIQIILQIFRKATNYDCQSLIVTVIVQTFIVQVHCVYHMIIVDATVKHFKTVNTQHKKAGLYCSDYSYRYEYANILNKNHHGLYLNTPYASSCCTTMVLINGHSG